MKNRMAQKKCEFTPESGNVDTYDNLIAECDSSCITMIGDFNANVKTRANFAVIYWRNFVSNLATFYCF